MTSSSDEPTRGRIAREIVLYALLVLAAGAAFVVFRYLREGDRVFAVDPHRRPSVPR